MVELLAGFIIAAITLQSTHASSKTPPHIVVILADDLGWNDVSFHGSDQIPTPNIDALAYNGVILNSHYVPALCTPSRASLLTGKYPTTLGMQHLVILAQEPWGLPLEETLLPEHLRRNGYSTHAVGKWHLGFHKKEYTPLYRGFDTFYGYYNGYHDYYDHSMEASDQDVPQRGFDMRRGLDVDFESRGKYSTDLFTEEAVNIIHNHNNTQGPMFLYLAHLAPHAGNSDKPYQAPDEDIARFSYIQDAERRVYAAMVHRMDQGVGAVISALRATGKLENSIVLFMSDNGAVTFGVHSNHGSNYPLRGLKESPWEGGLRGVAALWSPLLNKTRRVSKQMMHSSDWLPTLLSAAGIRNANIGDIDGKDMWNELTNDLPSARTEVFNNYDEVEDYSSLRVGSWKYISGTAQGGEVDDWYGDSGEEDSPPPYNINAVLMSETNVALSGLLTEMQLKNYPDPNSPQLLKSREALILRDSSVVSCSSRRQGPLAMMDPDWTNHSHINGSHTHQQRELLDEISFKLEEITRTENVKRHRHSSGFKEFLCDPRKETCLFHLDQDPCEELNLAHLFPQVVKMMEDRVAVLKRSVRPPLNQPLDPMADPALHDGVWTHWQEPEKNPELSYRSLMSLLTDQMTMSILDNVLFKIVTAPIFILGALLWQTMLGLLQTIFTGTCLIVVLGVTLIIGNFISNSQRQRFMK